MRAPTTTARVLRGTPARQGLGSNTAPAGESSSASIECLVMLRGRVGRMAHRGHSEAVPAPSRDSAPALQIPWAFRAEKQGEVAGPVT